MRDLDYRYMARRRHGWYKSLDDKKKTFMVEMSCSNECECGGGYCEEEVEFPFKYEVCSTCHGRGKHVNPDIDSHGIGAEEFAEDPDFAENYFSGTYDVDCYECGGTRVVPQIDEGRLTTEQKELFEQLWRQQQERAYYDRIEAIERAMGA